MSKGYYSSFTAPITIEMTCLDFWGSLGYLILIILSVFTSVFYVGIDKEIREKVISYIKNKILKCKTI